MFGYDVFHEEIIEKIIASIRNGTASHAYIFSGDEGLGVFEAAKLVANAFVCESELAPCGTCKACVMAKGGTHPDIEIVQPDDKKKSIGVGGARRINDDAFLKPFYLKKKVYLIDGNILTVEAQNALLKTIEEPPLFAVFIIYISDLSKLLDTIRSRCTIVNFLPLSDKKMDTYLTKLFPNMQDRLNFYVSYSDGNPGRAVDLINSTELSIFRDDTIKMIDKLLSFEMYDAFYVSAFFEKNKDNFEVIADISLFFLRDILLISNGLNNKVINIDYLDKLKKIATTAPPKRVLFAIERLSVMCEMKQRSISPKYIGMNYALAVKEEGN